MSGPKSEYPGKRFGTVKKKATSLLPVGRTGPLQGDPPDHEGWQVVALPWTPDMEGSWPKTVVDGVDEEGKVVPVELAFTRIAIPSLKGLRMRPVRSWDGRFSDFPPGVKISWVNLKRAYGGSGDAALMSESSVEFDDAEEEEDEMAERRRKGALAASISATVASGSSSSLLSSCLGGRGRSFRLWRRGVLESWGKPGECIR